MAFPFDRSFKVYSEEDQRAHLALFSHVPLDAEIEVLPQDREVNIGTRKADMVCMVHDRDGKRICHQEVVTRYDSRALDNHYWYVHLFIAKYRMDVDSSLILLTQAGVPDILSPSLKVDFKKFKAEAQIEIVRMWEMPAKEALAMNRLAICPLVPLMDATIEDEREAARRIMESGRRDLAATMGLFGALRHGNKEVYQERRPMLEINEEILKESGYYQWIIEMGEAKGKAAGEANMARLMLKDALNVRFGLLPEWVEARLAGADAATLRSWFLRSQSVPEIDSVFQ